jgi:hypothetical protein
MAPRRQPADNSAFRVAVAEIEAGLARQQHARPEISFESEPPPRRLAPHAAAVAATVTVAGREVGWGRFVLLHDPAEQDGWAGPFRVIAYLRAELDPEIAADPLVGQVGWSWLTEALDSWSARYAAPSGTVTRVVTEGFGTKQDEPIATEFEMRASWSPQPGNDASFLIDRHVEAWADALCVTAGLPPLASGVTQLRPPRQARPRHPPAGRGP